MKLLVVSHSCSATVNQDLFARVQRQTGWELTLVVPRSWKTEYGQVREAEKLPGLEGKLLPVPVALNGNIPLHLYRARMARLLRREAPDVVYVQHDPHALATMQVFRANARSVRAPIGFKNEQNIPRRYPLPIRMGERFVYRHAAFGIVPARPPAEALREKGYEGPLEIVPYGLDLSVYRPQGTIPRDAKSLTAGYLGRLEPAKGPATLIEALPHTPERVRALVVGTGSEEEELRSLSSRLGVADRVEWRGFIEHGRAPDAYAEMDLLVVPSRTTPTWKEQFGRVVIEALACGVPVCSSDSGEPPALVERTGGGWTFPEGNAERLAERLGWADANRDQLRERGEAGLARVREEFSADAVADAFAEVIRRHGMPV